MSDENNTGNPQALSVLGFEELDNLLFAYNQLLCLLPNDNGAIHILDILNQSFSVRLNELKKVVGFVNMSQM
jgi:hypothetical protein